MIILYLLVFNVNYYVNCLTLVQNDRFPLLSLLRRPCSDAVDNTKHKQEDFHLKVFSAFEILLTQNSNNKMLLIV